MVTSLPKKLVLLGTLIHSKSRQELEYLHNAAVGVDQGGVIAGIERGQEGDHDAAAAKSRILKSLGWDQGEVEVVASKPGQFFFPGLIDTHIHASQYPNVGIFGKSTLLDWLETYTFPLEASLADLAKARRVYTACVRRTLAHGTTTAAYYATRDVAATNLLADICLAAGQRAFVGRVCMDSPGLCPDYYRDETPEAALRATRETVAHVESRDPGFDLVSPIVTPRFAPACSSEAMLGLAAIARGEDDQGRATGRPPLPIQTHISENRGEMALVAQLFPEAGSYAAVYDTHGLLTPRTILAHAVHLDDAEARLIAARGAKVSHCPCSNSSITSGAARVRWLWDRGLDVGLGTDLSGGYSPSVLEAARQATLVSRHVAMGVPDDEIADEDGKGGSAKERAKLTVDQVLYLATRGGALCVGLEDRVGGFEVGKQWDAQLVTLASVDDDGEASLGGGDPGNVDVFGWETWDERIAKWVYNGDDRNTTKVWVRGRLVHSRR